MITLSFHDSQIVKYAKNHFKNKHGRTDKENLKILIGYRNAIDPKYISDKDMVIVLCSIMEELNIPIDARFLVDTIFGSWTSPRNQSTMDNFIDNWRSEVANTAVKNGDKVLIQMHPVQESLLEPRNDVQI